jgi:predicted TIM-barrel fold metal-dependent hydrolase
VAKYALISADSHVLEPPDLFTSRVPAKFRNSAPKHVPTETQGDQWWFPNSPQWSWGLNQCGGLPPEQYSPIIKWDNVRAEAYQQGPREKTQAEAGVVAEIMYPSPKVVIAMHAEDKDPEYHLALIRAYNDWLSEYCSANPDFYVGLALVPSGGSAKVAADEIRRFMKLPGIKGAQINKYPTTGQRLHADDDEIFKACIETGATANYHVGLAQSDSSTPKQAHEFIGAFTGCYRFYDPPIRMSELIYTKVFDRFPELQVVWGEVDVGWVPYLMEQLDDRIERQSPKMKVQLKKKPSDYFKENFHYVVVKDPYGIKNRDAVGTSRIMWSSDFPHATCDFPDYGAGIDHDFKNVPADELDLMLRGNAAKLYGL